MKTSSPLERLSKAIESEETLKIIYQGGSQPGTLREIIPLNINKDKVWAKCLKSNSVKCFVIDKIIIIEKEEGSNIPEWKLGLTQFKHYISLEDFFDKKKTLLNELGWYVKKGKDFISLHRRFKNGKVIKHPDVSLWFEEINYYYYVDTSGRERKKILGKRQRPWVVRGKNQNTRTFSTLDKAAKVFIEWAKLLSPKS